MVNAQERIAYWRTTAKRDLKTAEALHGLKRYDACLFFGHLALEKTLKGLVEAKTGSIPPYTHDLERLAKMSTVSCTEEQYAQLRTIKNSTFQDATMTQNMHFTSAAPLPIPENGLPLSPHCIYGSENNSQSSNT
jgi:hypothetical protein